MRTFAIASLGGMLEFYDFVVFIFLSKAIETTFFPADAPEWLNRMQVFGLFAAGYLARPLGGVVMGHVGDRTGRKRVFVMAVLMMAVPTLVIGCLPGYAQLGYLAPCVLLVCRILQGASVGGEIPGAWVFVSEHAPRHRIGLACGLLTAGLTAGILLASIVNAGLRLIFTPAQISDYAWRLPFLLGGLFGLAAVMVRGRLAETPVFEAMRRDARSIERFPVRSVLRNHRGAVAVSMMATWFLTAVIVVLVLLAPVLVRHDPAIHPAILAAAPLIETAVFALSCALCGLAIDRFGLKPLIWVAAVAIPISGYLLYGTTLGSATTLLVFVIVGAAAGVVVFVPVAMVRAFPAPLAFSGVSTSYNAAYAIVGGVTPPLMAYLAAIDPVMPAHYVALSCVASAAVVLVWLRRCGDTRGLA